MASRIEAYCLILSRLVYPGPVYDACVFHEWASVASLAPYLSEGWNAALNRPDTSVLAKRLYPDPRGAKASSALPEEGPAGSNAELLLSDLFGNGTRPERVVLGYDDGLFATSYPNHYVAQAIVEAANEWTVAEWLSRDDRLHGMVLVTTALPDAAAAEIRRRGEHPQMVAVALGANGLSRPFGHPVYHPIYEAAAEHDLPVVVQAGASDAFGDSVTSAVAGGTAATTAEFRALSWQSHAVHLSSMIVGGVFNLFPNLKLVLVGGGATWVTGQLLRLDYWYRMSTREARWLDRLPSEYFEDHVRIVTHGLEEADRPEVLEQALTTVPGIERVLLYGSGYPDADWDTPEAIGARLPSSWHPAVFFENALNTFRWPTDAVVGSGAANEKGVVQ